MEELNILKIYAANTFEKTIENLTVAVNYYKYYQDNSKYILLLNKLKKISKSEYKIILKNLELL